MVDKRKRLPTNSGDTKVSRNQNIEEVLMASRNWRKDQSDIFLLTFLYVLQGIPLGFAASVPYILSTRNISYTQQAIFSFVFWPFSLKLLWAPIVDSLYFRKMGRRKSWLIPIQYFIGFLMMYLSYFVNSALEERNISFLVVIFFVLNLLAATQDIAVDGWALSILSEENVSYASTCNSVGQTAGYFISYAVFLALESKDFCSTYVYGHPVNEGLITFEGFLFFWGVIFVLSTSFVWFFKRERAEKVNDNLILAYKELFEIVKLRPIVSYIVVALSCKFAFAATDSVTSLKLIDAGVKRANLVLMGMPLIPLQIVLPLIIAKFTKGPNPMNLFAAVYPLRLFLGVLFAGLVYWTYQFRSDTGEFPLYYYAIMVAFYLCIQVVVYIMFVQIMAFHAEISDPSVGGTYMTLLNTVSNCGGSWSQTLILWLVDPLTFKYCSLNDSDCRASEAAITCKEKGGACITVYDGYYILVGILTVFGLIWISYFGRVIRHLQSLPKSSWRISRDLKL